VNAGAILHYPTVVFVNIAVLHKVLILFDFHHHALARSFEENLDTYRIGRARSWELGRAGFLACELRLAQFGVATLDRLAMLKSERLGAAMLRCHVIGEPAPLAIAVPDKVLAMRALGRFRRAHGALDAQADVTTEATNLPETLKVPI
jgi:hypothetical protein